MSGIQTDWCRWFGDIPPLGYILRERCHDRWVRFHALPDSKRYADSVEEEQIVLSRANVLAERIPSDTHECAMITDFWEDLMPIADRNADWTWVEEPEPDAYEHSFIGSRHLWQQGVFDAIFRQIANEERRSLFLNLDTGEVLAPYDDGFDVICRNNSSALKLRQTFASWLSAREDGL